MFIPEPYVEVLPNENGHKEDLLHCQIEDQPDDGQQLQVQQDCQQGSHQQEDQQQEEKKQDSSSRCISANLNQSSVRNKSLMEKCLKTVTKPCIFSARGYPICLLITSNMKRCNGRGVPFPWRARLGYGGVYLYLSRLRVPLF